MRTALLSLALVAVAPGFCNAAGPFRLDRPCGPGISNLLVPQEYFGADFRPACRRHDRCYSSNSPRGRCDDRFERDLLRACERSRFKLGCRLTAKMMSNGTKLFGGLYRRR